MYLSIRKNIANNDICTLATYIFCRNGHEHSVTVATMQL